MSEVNDWCNFFKICSIIIILPYYNSWCIIQWKLWILWLSFFLILSAQLSLIPIIAGTSSVTMHASVLSSCSKKMSSAVDPFIGIHSKGSSVWVTSINKQCKISSYLTPLLHSLLLNKLERFYFSVLIDLSHNLPCYLLIQPLCCYCNVPECELVFDYVMWPRFWSYMKDIYIYSKTCLKRTLY